MKMTPRSPLLPPSQPCRTAVHHKLTRLVAISLVAAATIPILILLQRIINMWDLGPRDPLERAHWLMRLHPTIDAHNDWANKIQAVFGGAIASTNLTYLGHPFHTDINRLRSGRISGQFWSAFIPCSDDTTIDHQEVPRTLTQIDLIKRIIASYPQTFQLATTAHDIRQSIAQHGRIASLIGIEGGHQIQDSLSVLRMYYDVGVRYMTLTHVCHTSWADSCTKPPIHNGLTQFGVDVITEMNRLGMLIDISHVSHQTMRDVVRVTKAPLFVSHSGVYGVCPNPRNVPDDILLAMKDLDGVIMINFWPELIGCGPTAALTQVVDHIDYVSRLVGSKHVGFGADFDGINQLTDGLEDVGKYPNLVGELIRRGYSDEAVVGMMGGNVLRVMEKSEKVARRMAEEGALASEAKSGVPRPGCARL